MDDGRAAIVAIAVALRTAYGGEQTKLLAAQILEAQAERCGEVVASGWRGVDSLPLQG
jgi:hypothetical protein